MIDLIALGGMTVTILTTMWIMFRSLRTEIKDLSTELKAEINDLSIEVKTDISKLDASLNGMKERMAHLEGLLEGLREAITRRRTA